MNRLAGYSILFLIAAAAVAQTPAKPPQTAADRLRAHFHATNAEILEMAKDFPADKYNFRLKPEMRSFGEVIVHVASGNMYAAKAGRGERVKWDEIDPKKYADKAAIVALFEDWNGKADAALKENPEGWQKSLEPFISVIEHSAEHYGLLVAYYRANGLVPPASRPKSK